MFNKFADAATSGDGGPGSVDKNSPLIHERHSNDVEDVQNNDSIRVIVEPNKLNSTSGSGDVPIDSEDEQHSVKVETQISLVRFVKNHFTFGTSSKDNDDATEGQPSAVQQEDDVDPTGRESWGKKLDFLLSVIGFAVDLGNVVRFPSICYRNGGGAFLIPYLIMLLFGGLPLFYLELALGQYQRVGALSVWSRICPMMKGIGFGILFISSYVAMYYNTIIAWAVYYLVMSIGWDVPWRGCNNSWNTNSCFVEPGPSSQLSLLTYNNSNTSKLNSSDLAQNDVQNRTSDATEFFYRHVQGRHLSAGIGDLGSPRWQLVLCLAAVFVIVYFSLWKGIKSSGKAVWFTAIFPYVVLTFLLCHAASLPGALDGISYYVYPKIHKLAEKGVWLDAASQIFFSLGPGFGVLLALSSYNKFHNNCYKDALVTSAINCATSFLSGFVVFATLGYMSKYQGRNIEDLLSAEDMSMVFITYPEAISTLRFPVFFSIVFFLMLITLGLDSTFGGLQSAITACQDEWPVLRKHRELFVLGVVIYCFVGALPTTTNGGSFVINLLDLHGVTISILAIVFMEAVSVCWLYGVKRFSADIKMMLGHEPNLYWKACWTFISPVFLLILFILNLVEYNNTPPGEDPADRWGVKPFWFEVAMWGVTLSSICCIPIYMVYKFMKTSGTFLERLLKITQPETRPPHEANELPASAEDTVPNYMEGQENIPLASKAPFY